MTRLLTLFVCVVSVSLLALAQDEPKGPPRQLPPPSDVDPLLTEQLRQQEQRFCDAILHKDAKSLDSLVGPEFTLRVADVP